MSIITKPKVQDEESRLKFLNNANNKASAILEKKENSIIDTDNKLRYLVLVEQNLNNNVDVLNNKIDELTVIKNVLEGEVKTLSQEKKTILCSHSALLVEKQQKESSLAENILKLQKTIDDNNDVINLGKNNIISINKNIQDKKEEIVKLNNINKKIVDDNNNILSNTRAITDKQKTEQSNLDKILEQITDKKTELGLLVAKIEKNKQDSIKEREEFKNTLSELFAEANNCQNIISTFNQEKESLDNRLYAILKQEKDLQKREEEFIYRKDEIRVQLKRAKLDDKLKIFN